MVKHVTRRSYKKRASKKRRTIRKLKKTMRRKMQRGGNLGVVAPVFILFAALFANNPTVTKVLSVAQTLLGGDSQGGGNKRLNQMGGGEQFNRALDGLRGTINEDTTLTDDRKTELIGCIDTLTSNGGISDADIAQMASNEPQVGGMLGFLKEKTAAAAAAVQEKAAAAAAAVQEKAAAAAAAAQERAATSFQAAQTAMGELKDNRMAKFMDNIKNQIETVKSKIVNKVSIMKDPNKHQCMKSILSYGFDLIKNKISSGISVENITKAMALKAALAKEKGTDLLRQGSEKGTDLLRQGSEKGTDLLRQGSEFGSTLLRQGSALFSRGLGSVKPSSTLLPGDGGGVIQEPNQPTDEENKAALIAANIEANKSYDAAVEVRNAAKSKVTHIRENGIQNQATEDELKQAQTATSEAYQVALNAAKAAIAGGVPENEVKIPKV